MLSSNTKSAIPSPLPRLPCIIKITFMKIAVRCQYFRPITPNFLILNLEEKIWSRFLWGDTQTRIDIVIPYLPCEHPPIRELSWIPLDGLSESDKTILIINLLKK